MAKMNMQCNIVDCISKDTLLPKGVVENLINSAPYRYKLYHIPKKSGKGVRLIAQPAREIKKLQYWVIDNILKNFPIHPSATAYQKGKNIKYNVTPHSASEYLLKLDFTNFFPSITSDTFSSFIRNNNIVATEHDINLLTKILFRNDGKKNNKLVLSIGAPSSPLLSNIIMFDFDSTVYNFCSKNKINYTRYADDLTFSTNDSELRSRIMQFIHETLQTIKYPKLTLNNKKTIFASKANRRIVTGLIITNDDNISVGREKKRIIRSQVCHFLKGNLSEKERGQLKGMIAFIQDVEPFFLMQLKKKYGDNFTAGL